MNIRELKHFFMIFILGILTGCLGQQESRPLRFNGGRLMHYCQGYEQTVTPPFVNNYLPAPAGTVANPYMICTKAQMDAIAGDNSLWDKNFILMQDISMANGATNNGIIGTLAVNFTGTFNGQNYTISNYRYVDNTTDYVGLFGYIGAAGVVRNLRLTSVTIDGQDFVGSLAGFNLGTITNASVAGTVAATAADSDDVGGMMGYNNGTVSMVSSTVTVSGTDDNIGGLIGRSLAAVSDSYATGAVTGNAAGQIYVGGLIGNNNTAGTLTNCYATGAVLGTDSAGGLIGGNFNGSNITTSYATGNVTCTATSCGGLIGRNTNSNVTSSYATGTVTGVDNVGGLIGEQVNAPTITSSYATGTVSGSGSDIGGLIGEVAAAATITSSYYRGVVTNTGGDNTGGLVGLNSAATINGVSYVSAVVTGFDDHTGGLVGQNIGTITGNSYASGPVTATDVVDPANIGGLVGYNNSGTINGAYAGGVVTGGALGANVGGLAGFNDGTITNAYAVGAVTGSGGDIGGLIGETANSLTAVYASGPVTAGGTASRVGGLVGYSSAGGNNIDTSYALGNVVCTQNSCGGLIGENVGSVATSFAKGNVTGSGGIGYGGLVGNSTGTITTSYALGEVQGPTSVGGLVGVTTANVTYSQAYGPVYGSTTQTGGLVGFLNSSATVDDCYAVGPVTGVARVGGLVGYTDNGTIQDSYALGNVYATGVNIGGLVGYYFNGGVGVIQNSWAQGDVYSAGGNSGGLVGKMEGNITESFSRGDVTETATVGGGLVGDMTSGTVLDSYALGDVTVTGTDAGGLIGLNAGTVTRAHASGRVAGGANAGGLIGNDAAGVYTDNYWDATINNTLNDVGDLGNVANITGETTVNMMTAATYPGGWDFAATWVMYKGLDGFDYPRLRDLYFCHGANLTDAPYANSLAAPAGTRADPIKICTGTQLDALGGVAADWGKYFILGEDIDLGAFLGTNFDIIGNAGTAFSGTLEGRGYTINAFNYTSATADDVGVFGYVNGDGVFTGSGDGLIVGVNIRAANVSADTNVGSLVGRLGTGGIFAVNVNNGSITGATDVGGVVGKNSGDVRLVKSWATVNGTTTTGGVVGENVGTLMYASGTGATHGTTTTGGIVGTNSGTIKNSCASQVVVTGTTTTAGAVGINSGSTQLSYSGGANPGMFQTNTGSVASSYYDDTLKTSASVAGTALTNAQMQVQGNFTNFDFNLNWNINGVSYPVLKWE